MTRAAIAVTFLGVISVLGGATETVGCLPSVGTLWMLSYHRFSGFLAGVSLGRGGSLVVWMDSWMLRLVDSRTGADLSRITAPPGLLFTGRVALTGHGLLAVGVSDGTVRVWNLSAGREVASFPSRLAGACVALSPDGTLLSATGPEGELRVWLIASGDLRLSFSEFVPSGPVCPLAFSPDGRWLMALAWWGLSPLALVWDLESGHVARAFTGPAEFLSDGRVAVLVREAIGAQIELWAGPVGEKVGTVRLPSEWEVTQVSSGPGGSLFAVVLKDGTIQVWDGDSARGVAVLPGCALWDPATGEEPRAVSVAFSPDGKEVLIAVLFPELGQGKAFVWTLDGEGPQR